MNENIDEQIERLRRPRLTVRGNRVSSEWSARAGCWLTTHHLADGGVLVEPLEVSAPDAVDAAQLAELDLICRGAPALVDDNERARRTSHESFYPDAASGHWTAFVPCRSCGGFPLRLRLRVGGLEGSSATDPSPLEQRMARLVAYRAVIEFIGHEGGEDCLGCAAEIADSPSGYLAEVPLSWFCPRLQEWHVRLPLDSDFAVQIPLGLPAWSCPDEVDRAARQIAFGVVPPYDQEAEA